MDMRPVIAEERAVTLEDRNNILPSASNTDHNSTKPFTPKLER